MSTSCFRKVKTPVQPQQPLTSAFPLTCLSLPPPGGQLRNSEHGNSFLPCSLTASLTGQTHRPGTRPRSEPVLDKLLGGCGGAESLGSGSCCSTPPGSSCYSSQRSSPAQLSTFNHPDSPLRSSVTHSLSRLLLEEDEETNVDTGVAVSPCSDTAVKTITCSSSSIDLLRTHHSERPAAVGASSVEELAKELTECLPQTGVNLQMPSGGCKDAAVASRTTVFWKAVQMFSHLERDKNSATDQSCPAFRWNNLKS
ncbi:hypothetical protein ATANTOWER_031686 [Ataeniobius toweri]|uniref:Uncharacterized protein n=1 Tax=Ataeniobius toweri TaxID=208326 RepID=A0ABU7B4T8_9TELE|nr:hypothetical protein [Ataeniobius toweri]